MKKQMIQFMIFSLLFTGCTATATQSGSSFQKNEISKEAISKAKTEETANIKDKEMDTESKQKKLKSNSTSNLIVESYSKSVRSENGSSQMKSVNPSSTKKDSSFPSSSAGKTDDSNKNESSHVHSWNQQYKVIHHEEIGHNEIIVVSEAWDEPIYTMVAHDICNNCGLDFTATGISIDQHFKESFMYGDGKCGSFRTEWIRIQTGTIHHPAETETRYVVDQTAYDEQVANGFRCTICGAEK